MIRVCGFPTLASPVHYAQAMLRVIGEAVERVWYTPCGRTDGK